MKLLPLLYQIFATDSELKLSALSLVVVLVQLYPQTAHAFMENNIPNVMKNIEIPPNYENFRSEFLSHFQI